MITPILNTSICTLCGPSKLEILVLRFLRLSERFKMQEL